MSAQITAVPRSLRASVGSPTAKAASQHSSLRDTLVSLGLPASTTKWQLYDLLSKLDYECLRHATKQDSTSDADTVAESAMFLSGSLSKCRYPGTFAFLEIQLRALISSLALLQRKEVGSLDSDFYDRLRLKNISARFQRIAFQLQHNSTLADKIRHTPNVYLIQLASEYASFIKRDDSPWPSIFEPLTKIFFAGLSLGGSQYGQIRDIISGIVELGNVWQKPQTKYLALCGVQEYTRLVTSRCRELDITDVSNEIRKAVVAIVTSLLDQVNGILATENGNFPPELATRWHRTRAFFTRGPPILNQGWFYYGLLDCVSQLAAVSEPRMLGQGLVDKVETLIFDSVVPEFRWKAIEILLSCWCTRTKQYQGLANNVSLRVSVENQAIILEEMKLIKEHLDDDEDQGLRFRVLQPLTCLSSSGPQIIPPESEVPSTGETKMSTPERALARSPTVSSTKFSISVSKFNKSYHSAGIFKDGRHAFFNNDSELSVYKLGDLRSKPVSLEASRVFTQEYKQRKDREYIRNVASSESCIMIVTNKRLQIYSVDAGKLFGTASHEKWDPSGLACHESKTQLVVFLGQVQRDKRNEYIGQIKVLRYRKQSRAEGLAVCALNVLANDCPKRLFFDTDSQILTCITRTQNKVLVWKLNDEFFSSLKPFEFLKNNYTAETEVTGVTSATIYRSPSNRPYVLCTTAPSSERWLHDGEWSFILPVHEDTSRSSIHPVGIVHNFEQFKYHRPLFAGCASSRHHLFAVLEKSGKLSVLGLDKHDDGGIHGQEEAEILPHSLCKQDRPLTDCLRFDTSGSYLMGIDPKGTIIVTEFREA